MSRERTRFSKDLWQDPERGAAIRGGWSWRSRSKMTVKLEQLEEYHGGDAAMRERWRRSSFTVFTVLQELL